MNFPYLETTFKTDLDNETIDIISKYWELQNGVFKYTPTELRQKLNITQPKLNSIIKDNSETILFLENCIECGNVINILVTNQSTAKRKLDSSNFQCEICLNKFKTELQEIEPENHKLHRLKYAIKVSYWNKLTREELAVLRKIIEFNDYKVLRKKLIQQNFEYYWPIIEKLDRFSLIDIQRESLYDGKILKIYFLPELVEKLEVNNKNYVSIENELTFNIPKRVNRERETQPNFSKRIVFSKDILIREGEEYICSIWENADGSINFGLKLLSEIKNTEKFDKESEPKSIGEIINKIIN